MRQNRIHRKTDTPNGGDSDEKSLFFKCIRASEATGNRVETLDEVCSSSGARPSRRRR